MTSIECLTTILCWIELNVTLWFLQLRPYNFKTYELCLTLNTHVCLNTQISGQLHGYFNYTYNSVHDRHIYKEEAGSKPNSKFL